MNDGNDKQRRAKLTADHITETHEQEIVKTSMDGFLIHDAHGRILDINDAYCKLTGYCREELLNNHITSLEPNEKPDEMSGHFEKIKQLGSGRFATRQRRKDGTVVDLEICANYSSREGGIFFSTLRAIADRIPHDNELLLKEEEYRIFVENSPT